MVNHKLKLPYSRVADTAVVMVHKVHHGMDGPLRHLLHTLKDDERPVDLHRSALQKYREVTLAAYVHLSFSCLHSMDHFY